MQKLVHTLIVSSAMLVSWLPAHAAALDSGSPAPAFSLPSTEGAKVSLADYKRKIVVLEWFNSGCPFVRKHYESSHMQKLQKEYRAKGVVWLTIASSGPGRQGHASAKEHNAKLKSWNAAPSAMLMDEDGRVGQLYGAKTTPHMFVINSAGMVAYQGAIDDRRTTDIEDIAGAKNYVQTAVNEIIAGKPVTTPETEPYGCSVKYAE